MRILTALFILILPLTGFSQDSLHFDFDTAYYFRHFSDHWVTRVYNFENNTQKPDTIYSCDYDEKGQVKSERISNDGHLVDGIKLIQRDSTGQINSELFYEDYANYVPEILTRIQYTTHQYKNGRLQGTKQIECERNVLNDSNANPPSLIEDSVCKALKWNFEGFKKIKYTNDWTFRQGYITHLKYNDKNLVTQISGSNESKAATFETNWDYDAKDRYVKLRFCEKIKGSRNNCNMNIEVSWSYTDSSSISISNMLGTLTKTDTIYNNLNQVVRVLETSTWTDTDDFGHAINRISETETIFFYDQFGRLERKEKYDKNHNKPTIFRYYYKKRWVVRYPVLSPQNK